MQRVIKAEAVKSDINVTPLVDVVLVLLIIFMVVTPMLQKGAAVQLPMTSNPPKKPEEKAQILIAVEVNKNVWIDKEKIPEAFVEAQFGPKIDEAFQRSPSATVVIKGDKRLTFGDIKKTMLTVKKAGFTSVGLISEKKQAAK
jgi:biopolymer transport protein ExbD